MSYKEVSQVPIWDFDENPELEGIYRGKQTDVGENKSNLYRVERPDGMIAFWGSTVLDTKMANVGEGALIKVIFKGKVKSKVKGRSPYKDYSVLQDDGQ